MLVPLGDLEGRRARLARIRAWPRSKAPSSPEVGTVALPCFLSSGYLAASLPAAGRARVVRAGRGRRSRPNRMSEPSAAEDVSITRRAGVVALGTLGSRRARGAARRGDRGELHAGEHRCVLRRLDDPNTPRAGARRRRGERRFHPVFSRIDETEGRAARSVLRPLRRLAHGLIVIVSALGVVTARSGRAIPPAPARTGQFELTAQLTAWCSYLLFAGSRRWQAGALNALGLLRGRVQSAVLTVAMIAAPGCSCRSRCKSGCPAWLRSRSQRGRPACCRCWHVPGRARCRPARAAAHRLPRSSMCARA